jgi:hypothetical protein
LHGQCLHMNDVSGMKSMGAENADRGCK